MEHISEYDLQAICKFLSYTSIFRLHATGCRKFSAKHLLSAVYSVESHEIYKLDHRVNPKIIKFADNTNINLYLLGKTLTDVEIYKLTPEILEILPHTVTKLVCCDVQPNECYKFHEGLIYLSIDNVPCGDELDDSNVNFVFPETLERLSLKYEYIVNVEPLLTFPSNLKLFETDIVITSKINLPTTLTELYAAGVNNDVDMKKFTFLTSIYICDDEFDYTRCSSSITSIGIVGKNNIDMLKTRTDFIRVCTSVRHCCIHNILKRNRNLEHLFIQRDSRPCMHSKCKKSEIQLDVAAYNKLINLKFSAPLRGDNSFEPIDIKIMPGGFPITLKCIDLSVRTFKLSDILLFNDSIQDIIIFTRYIADRHDCIDFTSKHMLRKLDIISSDRLILLDNYKYPQSLQTLCLSTREIPKSIPPVSYLRLYTAYDYTLDDLSHICKIMPSSVIEFEIVSHEYYIVKMPNLICNKWRVGTYD